MATINTTSSADLRNLLNSSIALIAITFIKLDGSERTIVGSTNPVYIPQEDRPKSSPISDDLVKKSSAQENTITLYEVFEGQWRSIKYDRITKVEVAEVQPDISVEVADINEFDFGTAIEFLKTGQRVAREGWNGKGMYVYINEGSISIDSVPVNSTTVGGVSISLFDLGDHGTVTRMPNINMRAADGSTVTGWLASQTDMLAEDWTLVDG